MGAFGPNESDWGRSQTTLAIFFPLLTTYLQVDVGEGIKELNRYKEKSACR